MKQDFIRAASLGMEIAAAVFLGALAGYLADGYFKTGPWLMVLGLVIGSIVGFWNVYKYMLSEDGRI